MRSFPPPGPAVEVIDSPPPRPYDTRVWQGMRVAVFGRADLEPGSRDYAQAEELGALLAGEGCVVLCGGYAGAMEAVSRGAARAGGESEGVVCRAFPDRFPNPFLTRLIWTNTLLERTRVLLERGDAYVALEPRTGTLAEVATLWALRKAGHSPSRPLVLVGDVWVSLRGLLARTGTVEENLLNYSVCVTEPRQAVGAIAGWDERERRVHGKDE